MMAEAWVRAAYTRTTHEVPGTLPRGRLPRIAVTGVNVWYAEMLMPMASAGDLHWL